MAPFAFSIVIPTLNEEKYLPILLQNLEAQTFKHFEVIHVDGKSEDGTTEVAKKFQKKLTLKTLDSLHSNVSTQRNGGGEIAQAEWIIFMDADVQFAPSFLQDLKNQLEEYPQTDIFTCWIESENRLIADQAIAQAMNVNLEVSYLFKNYCAFGSMIGVKKEAFLKKPFDEKQRVLEDAYFVRDLVDLGFQYKIFKTPKYKYSLRRVRKQGSLKSLRDAALLQLRLIYGEKISLNEDVYPMLGGKYYQNKKDEIIEKDIRSKIKLLSEKQLEKLKKIIAELDAFFE